MILTDNEKQYVKDLYRIDQIKKELKQKEDLLWQEVDVLKLTEKWDDIQTVKESYRNDIKPLNDEIVSLT